MPLGRDNSSLERTTQARGGAAAGASVLGRLGYVGLFLIAMATLVFEILLTRIFSVTLWYHFAFFAVSIAMLGMSAGALAVYLWPRLFAQHQTKRHLALFSMLFAAGIVASMAVHLNLPVDPTDMSPSGLWNKLVTCAVVAVPFTCSGVVVCLVLTRFPLQVSRLYGADLVGAALGCIVIIYALDLVGDAISVVVLTSAVVMVAALSFAFEAEGRVLAAVAGLGACALLAASLVLAVKFNEGEPLVAITRAKGELHGLTEQRALYERWNAYSRIKIIGDRDERVYPLMWGPGAGPPIEPVHQLMLYIDATAGTSITRFDGDLEAYEYLERDVSNVAHHIRPNAKVAIIGVGGGRDVLSALVFEQREIVGIEINDDILEAVRGPFGDYSGRLDLQPGVRYVNDEARSYLTRQGETFDIIQASLIDTWAASAAGAFALSENSLYTVDAWTSFLQRLTPRGVLSFTRWYTGGVPSEMYRMMSLAVAALTDLGVESPRDHIVIVRKMWWGVGEEDENKKLGAGTMLVSREPFTGDDLRGLRHVSRLLEFDLVHTPKRSVDPRYAQLADPHAAQRLYREFLLDITPVTDDRPFFFNMLRFRDIFDSEIWNLHFEKTYRANLMAVSMLGSLLLVVGVLTVLCLIVPLIWTRRQVHLGRGMPLLTFFAAIGLGFMLVEISQLQRLSVFLGHPTYSVAVVLFTMLLFSGLGSLSTQAVAEAAPVRPGLIRLGCTVVVAAFFALATPAVLEALRSAPTAVRILASVGILAPLGFTMGMAFPLGMKLAAPRQPALTPWLWGINGATSVLSSVLAVALAMAWGISVALWCGVACYAAALLAYAWAGRRLEPLERIS